MMKQRRKALWSLFGISMLFIFLMGGLSSYGRTTNSKGSVNSTINAASQIIAPPPVRRPWTAVASTGVVDEDNFDEIAFGLPPVGGSAAGYKIGSFSLDNIILRYNVTNTFDNNKDATGETPNKPGWDTLELGSFAPVNSQVRATLYRVRPCYGIQEAICTATNNGEGNNCRFCKADALGDIDFGNYLYYVEVMLDRNIYQANPRAHTLRLY